MATEPYHFFINSFLVITRDSYKKALSLGVDHKAKLVANQADADIAAILLTFDPVLQAYLNADQNLSAVLGTYKGKTQTVEELFVLMNHEKLAYWEGQVFSFYPKGTATATEIFPQGRKPFESGTYEQRIQAIKVLGDKCATIVNLGPVSVNMLAFHLQIESARQLQQSVGEGNAETMRTLRETARVMLCQEMFGDMGTLLHKYRANPEAVGNYFDMVIMRSHDHTKKFNINGSQVLNIKKNVEPGDLNGVKVKNTSTAASAILYIYTSATIDGAWNGQGLSFAPGEQKVIDETTFGTILAFLNVQNQSGSAGSFEVTGL